MPNPNPQPGPDDNFSWDRWLMQGLKAFRRTLFRYDLGLPDEFWRHIERAAHELFTAGRILLRSLRDRRRMTQGGEKETRGPIDIDWG